MFISLPRNSRVYDVDTTRTFEDEIIIGLAITSLKIDLRQTRKLD